MKLSLKPFSKGLRSLEAEPQVALRRARNPFLKLGVRPGFQLKQTKKKDQPNGWSFQRLRRLRTALLFFFLVDFRKGENQEGFPDSAESGSGLCPENPRPFEKGRRKLYFACGRELQAFCHGTRLILRLFQNPFHIRAVNIQSFRLHDIQFRNAQHTQIGFQKPCSKIIFPRCALQIKCVYF